MRSFLLVAWEDCNLVDYYVFNILIIINLMLLPLALSVLYYIMPLGLFSV